MWQELALDGNYKHFFGGLPPRHRPPQRTAGGAVARRAYALVPCYGSTWRGVGLSAPALRFATGFRSYPSGIAICLLLMSFFLSSNLWASNHFAAMQIDSLPTDTAAKIEELATNKKHFTVGVRRKAILCNDTSTTSSSTSQALTEAPKLELSTPVVSVSANAPNPAARLPRLLGAELALMPIQEWDRAEYEQMKNNGYIYVVFRLSVGKNGKAANILFLDTNSRKLAHVIKEQVLAAVWSAALDADGEPTVYAYPIQVLYLPPNYEFIDDYED